MEFVALFTVILFIVAMAKIMKSYELAEGLKANDEDVIPDSESKNNATMMLIFGILFIGSVFYQMKIWGGLTLPEAASEHGVVYDSLMNVTMTLIFIVFVICQALLFWFAYKYYHRKGTKALWFPHNNRLELAWTIVPSIVLVMLIMYGLSVWKDIMRTEKEYDTEIELYAEQFSWTARYPGQDGKLGKANFSLITSTNGLGIITEESLKERRVLGNTLIEKYRKDTAELNTQARGGWNVGKVLGDKESKLSAEVANLRRLDVLEKRDAADYKAGEDDVLVKNEFVIPKGKLIKFQMRSKDIIHSAYMPHFRAQINCVPGMKTTFAFKPTITTEEMRTKLGDEEFEYYLLCNKICGASHYNMKMVIKVVEPEAYEQWLKDNVYKETEAIAEVEVVEAEANITK